MKKQVSTITGIVIMIVIAFVAFSGVFTYEYFKIPKEENNQTPNITISAVPTKVGECSKTKVTKIGTRLKNGINGPDIVGSGSYIKYTNGISQVSYDTIQSVENAHIGDEINLCLVFLPTNCPPGDDRGKIYKATDLRTEESWELPDSEHSCGGA